MQNQKPYSLASFINFVTGNFTLLVLALVLFAGGFVSGSLWTENSILKSGVGGTAALPSGGTGAAPEAPQLQLDLIPDVSDKDYIRGNKNAEITLVEYSDFECPFCARFHPTMVQVMEAYGDKVRWIYRHYPLPFHPNAQKAAEASECVAKQGGSAAFWKYADAVIAENDKLGGSLNADAILTAVKTAGVDTAAVQKCMDSGEMAAKVKSDLDAGAKSGISGTPGTVIITKDGQRELIPGALTFDQVKAMIDAKL